MATGFVLVLLVTIFFSVPDQEDAITGVQGYLDLVKEQDKEFLLMTPMERFLEMTDAMSNMVNEATGDTEKD